MIGKKAARDKARSKAHRKSARRAAEKESSVQQSATERRVKDVARKRYAQCTKAVEVDISMQGPRTGSRTEKTASPVAATAFVGRRQPSDWDGGLILTKDDAIKHGLRYIAWDGCEPKALLDKAGKICAVLVGSPKDKVGWAQVNDQAQSLFDQARSEFKLDPKQTTHRRGSYPAVAAGISYGGGQTRVSNLSHSDHNEGIVSRLLQHPAIKRLAGFGDGEHD
ncbi:hypothetical protein TRAPUB_13604 [Trametes pubescens]|uniref:Uncharacterized protein n=1 Tax=Trametes pubescens TaxID=154538 RepID=A0A1M2VQS3_TRAPU|nr:hypothetical protein TRAPUB_13604 [Trametes pubescens]